MGGDVRLLVKFKKNWADEFNCYGFKLYTQAEWDTFAAKIGNGFSSNFGTNEGWEDDEIRVTDYKVTEITEAEFDTLSTLFPEALSYGYGIFPDEVYRWDEEEDEDEDQE